MESSVVRLRKKLTHEATDILRLAGPSSPPSNFEVFSQTDEQVAHTRTRQDGRVGIGTAACRENSETRFGTNHSVFFLRTDLAVRSKNIRRSARLPETLMLGS